MGDFELGLFERYRPAAYLRMQVVLNLVFFVKPGPRFRRFRPQVGNIIYPLLIPVRSDLASSLPITPQGYAPSSS